MDGAIFSPSRGTGVVLEDADELAVATRNFVHRLLSRDLVCPPAYERIPKASTADSEADEPRNLRCDCQPLVYFLVVLAAPKDDTADFVSAATACRRYDVLAILTPVEPLDLPNVRLDIRVLQFFDRFDHQPGAKFEVVGFLIVVEPFQLFLLWRHQELKHKATLALLVQVVG